jgi:hypothetical protein
MVGACDTCGCLIELFGLPGRKDSNCAQCSTDIATIVSQYRRLKIMEREGGHTADLEAELVPILRRLCGRSRHGSFDGPSLQFWTWLEGTQNGHQVN